MISQQKVKVGNNFKGPNIHARLPTTNLGISTATFILDDSPEILKKSQTADMLTINIYETAKILIIKSQKY